MTIPNLTTLKKVLYITECHTTTTKKKNITDHQTLICASAQLYLLKICFYLFFMSIIFGLGKIPESEEPISIRKSSSKPEPKLIKYPNYSKFQFLVNRNRNRIRSKLKYFGYPNVSEIDLYTYILIIFRCNVYKNIQNIYETLKLV